LLSGLDMMTSTGLSSFALLIYLATACAAESEDDILAPDRPPESVGKGDAFCPSVPVGIAPQPVAPRLCAPPGQLSLAVQAEVNEFWGSSVQVCACGPDSADDCDMNAFSLFGLGWVYYDPRLVELLVRGGSNLPAYWLLAHEFGHELQGVFEKPPILLARELGADCYSGYFLGSLVCEGQVSEADLARTLDVVCQLGDGEHWLDLDSHGTCDERAKATLAGVRAYLGGRSALEACRL
jgi:hypothetical protein